MPDKNHIIRKIILLNFIAFFVFLCAAYGSAMRYRPATAFQVLSQYKTFNESVPAPNKVWKIVPDSTSDGHSILRFFVMEESESPVVCTLELPMPGSSEAIRLLGPDDSIEKISSSGLLLTTGFPAPCDVLPPVDVQDDGRLYQEKREAAGRLFVRNYRITAEPFTIDEARSKGWIRNDRLNMKTVVMITATDESGELAVRQLWPVNESAWWLYEETPQRQSWLIY